VLHPCGDELDDGYALFVCCDRVSEPAASGLSMQVGELLLAMLYQMQARLSVRPP
jgi:hypothetical protein